MKNYIFGTFKKACMKICNLKLMVSRLSWNAMLKITDIKLQTIKKYYVYLLKKK